MSPVLKIIDQIIIKKSFINDYPKQGVIFLTLDSLFNDPVSRNMVSETIISAINTLSFDSVASIDSRGYILSGIIAHQFANKGEQFIQKVKSKGDPHFVQRDTETEYSSDALQVLKDTIQKGKKYLLTDDLIATGGSILTAIQLIRACGGHVDTVFVMTELLDFGARELLKKEGIELVSLLKFTHQDLQKLLFIQECYDKNPMAPITYKLSQYNKGEQSLIQSTKSSTLTIHLASQSLLKKEAAQFACQGMFDPLTIDVVGHASQSGVNNQPMGYDETKQGCANRLEFIKSSATNFDNHILVSIENGVRYSEDDKRYYDFVHVMVKKGEITFSHTQDCCPVPTEIINAISKDTDQHFQETWGDVAQRIGLAKDAKNPHQEACFGGMSRVNHISQALCKALGKLKERMLEHSKEDIEDQRFNMSRLLPLKSTPSQNEYAKMGIFFTAPTEKRVAKTVDLYNQGCPTKSWHIDPKKVALNEFKIFSTGDAFSILSPQVEISGAQINIHVGVEHASYSPFVLLQEALQLCRCVCEHGAEEVTIALPEQFHPVLHCNDFNLLLVDLFEASGASKIYFYDKNYTGTLDDTHTKALIPLTLASQSNSERYQISRAELLNYLHPSLLLQTSNAPASLDSQLMHFTRKHYLNSVWSKIDVNHTPLVEHLCGKSASSAIKMPEIKVQPHVLLCCSANKPLAEKIAASLRLRGDRVKLHFVQGKGEHATIPSDVEMGGAVVTIVQSTRPNPNNIDETKAYETNGASSYFFETALIARQAHLRGAVKINLINPYQFSARSDRAEDNPKGKTGAYVQLNGLLLEAAGVNHVITAECHDAHTMSGSYTGKKIKGSAIAALSNIAIRIVNDWIDDPIHPMRGQLRLVMPDAGATKRTKELTLQLQHILGKKLCESRILGDKQRDSHQDDSALINSLNSGSIGINAEDKYLITDDETATGSTLCQAITNLKKNGAKDIAVIVIHNNMPLDWLLRQLCLARFLFLGVNDLHFSDTQEMGTLANDYDDLIHTYSQIASLDHHQVEEQIVAWFKKNISEDFSDKSDDYLQQAFAQFKLIFNQFKSRVTVHSLANEFATKVAVNPCLEIHAESHDDAPSVVANGAEDRYASDKRLLFFRPHTGRLNKELPANDPSMEVGSKSTAEVGVSKQ